MLDTMYIYIDIYLSIYDTHVPYYVYNMLHHVVYSANFILNKKIKHLLRTVKCMILYQNMLHTVYKHYIVLYYLELFTACYVLPCYIVLHSSKACFVSCIL